jgi:hypothetical protein
MNAAMAGAAGAISSAGGAGTDSVAGSGASSSGGSSGAGLAGGAGVPTAGAPQGGAAEAGFAGATQGDPLAPFPAPGCPGFTAYRVPKGSYLAVTGSFEGNSLKNGICEPLAREPLYDSCATVSNVDQCVCTVTSPPSCGQYCDGDYMTIALRAEPGKTFKTKMIEGDGWCVGGVPVTKGN